MLTSPLTGSRITGQDIAGFGGLALVAVGSIGPWATSPLTSVSGLNGDGKWTIALAVLAGWALAARGPSDIRVPAACLGILAFGIYDAVHIHQALAKVVVAGTQIDHVGWGVYAVILGALLTLAALAARWRDERTLRLAERDRLHP